MWVLRPYLIVAVALLMITAVELSNRRPLSERRRYPPATAVAPRAQRRRSTDQGGLP